MQTLEEMIRQLPPELQQEVADFVRSLLERRTRKEGKPLRQDWAGALKEYRNQYTSMSTRTSGWSSSSTRKGPKR